jgi:hypothetical protein
MRPEFQQNLLRVTLVLSLFGFLFLAAANVNAQEQSRVNGSQVDNSNAVKSTKAKGSSSLMPVFTNYKGITIGMSADEVRQKLDHLKDKGVKQDFFVFSNNESAQVFYDKKGMVQAISIDYMGNESNPPTAMAVLGEDPTAKANGAVYKLIRYPAAHYWVSYSRTAGDSPLVTVTMQKM